MERRNLLKLAAATLPASASLPAQKVSVKIVNKRELPAPLGGMEATTVEVTIPPGASSSPHRHGGMVLGYVIEGDFSFAIDDQPAKVIPAGESFYEPPGARHTTSANRDASKTCRILATIIAEKGKDITTPA